MSERKVKNTITMPVLAMRDLVVFPKMVMHFDVARSKSINALRTALNTDRMIFLVAQKNVNVENPQQNDVYKIGVVSEVKQIIKTPEGVTRVLVEGNYKAELVELKEVEGTELTATVIKISDSQKTKGTDNEIEALCRCVKATFEKYASIMPRMPKELYSTIIGEYNPEALFEAVVSNINMLTVDKQQLLEKSDIVDKLSILNEILAKEYEVLGIAKNIQLQVNENTDKNQRDYYLREQIKVIKEQLGEDDNEENEVFEYYQRIDKLKLSEEIQEKLIHEASRLLKVADNSSEASVIRNYLDTCLDLPWNKLSKDRIDIEKAQKILDKEHYGLKKVKDRILETIAVKSLTPDVKGQILCLVGPPGVGKTSIGKSIAHALGRKYVRVSLGGVKDESDIRGHRKTYIGSMPGRIINAIKQAGTKNPVILLDEIDKMSNDFRGDPSSAMLEVLDSEQNVAFRDHYIELPFDLSDVLFVTTANTIDTIAPPLLDRMDVIELTSYTREEKFNIAKKYLVPKQVKKNGMRATMIKFSDDALYALIDSYTREAGVRTLERTIASLCRKVAKKIVKGETKKIIVTSQNVEEYLGVRKYSQDLFLSNNEVGVANGLAWTSVGGVIMPLEVLILDGKGTIELTGSLGDVMKESAKIAISYCRSVAEKYNIQSDFYAKKDIHIHAPEGAVPKDGPSAGVTLVTSLISALSGIKVRCDVAMTGEVTLHGKVLPIGGLREKTMAAYKAGIKTVIIPFDNKADLEQVDDVVKASIKFVFAKTLSDVLDVTLVKSNNEDNKFISETCEQEPLHNYIGS